MVVQGTRLQWEMMKAWSRSENMVIRATPLGRNTSSRVNVKPDGSYRISARTFGDFINHPESSDDDLPGDARTAKVLDQLDRDMNPLGAAEGASLGAPPGAAEGAAEGWEEGEAEERADGAALGAAEGASLGAPLQGVRQAESTGVWQESTGGAAPMYVPQGWGAEHYAAQWCTRGGQWQSPPQHFHLCAPWECAWGSAGDASAWAYGAGVHGNQQPQASNREWAIKAWKDRFNQIADWRLSDRSHNQKMVSKKERGLWHVERWLIGPQNLRHNYADMLNALLFQRSKNKPRIVSHAACDEKHEVVQKMLALVDVNDKLKLAEKIKKYVDELMLKEYGTLALQQLLHEASDALDNLEARQAAGYDALSFVRAVMTMFSEELLVHKPQITGTSSQSLSPYQLVNSSLDKHGNHVVKMWVELLQQAARTSQAEEELQQVAKDTLQRVIKIVASLDEHHNAVSIGNHIHGCRIIQQLLVTPHCAELVEQLCDENSLGRLVTGMYGNYVVKEFLKNRGHNKHNMMLAVVQCVLKNFDDNRWEHYRQHRASNDSQGTFGRFRGHDSEEDPHCLWATSQFGRHVVLDVLGLQETDCPGVTAMLQMLVQMVGNPTIHGFHPKPDFRALLNKHSMFILEALQVCAEKLAPQLPQPPPPRRPWTRQRIKVYQRGSKPH